MKNGIYANKKLAVIGASYLQLPLVEKAQELGIEVHCFAWQTGAVCEKVADYYYPISTTEKDAILKKCLKIKIDGVLSIASDIAVPTVNYIAEKMNLISNTIVSSLNSTNKFFMRKKFCEENIKTPKFYFLQKEDSEAKEELSFPLIVKPVDRSGSRGVRMVNSDEELSLAVKRAKQESFVHECIVEEYVDGGEISVETISWYGKHYFLNITDKVTTGSPNFVEIEHHQPTRLCQDMQEKVYTKTKACLNALNIKFGASHSEFKIKDDGEIIVIEVAQRMGGDFIGSDLVELSTGYDYLNGVIDVSLGQFEVPVISIRKHSGIYFLYSETQYLKNIIAQGTDDYIVKSEVLDEQCKPLEKSSDRSGYLIYQSESKIDL